ncbi:MAG: hypothetical protein K6357_06185 [Elusimicrobiota bacterium]
MKILISLILFFPSFIKADDLVMKAMEDELLRTVDKLKLENFQKPYFVAYTVYDSSSCEISASFGDLESINYDFLRFGKVDLRIGAKQFDNSNFVVDLNKNSPEFTYLPVENDYDLIRQSLWRLTDDVYKKNLEIYSRKDAYRKKKEIKENYGDLTDEAKTEYYDKEILSNFKCAEYKDIIKKASAIFRKYSEIQSSNVKLNYENLKTRFVNSQGSKYSKNSEVISVIVQATVQDKEGYKIYDSKNFVFGNSLEVEEDIIKEIDDYAKSLSLLYNANPIDYYIGPAIFKDEASAQFFDRIFVRNISFYPPPETENESWLKYYYDIPKLVDRIGKRISSGFISVYDNPLIEKCGSKALIGSAAIDDEGVLTERIDLVKDGFLKNIYSSRKPNKYSTNSNGHGRGSYNMNVYPFPNNVFITSSKTTSYEKILEKAFDMAREQKTDKVIVFEKLLSEYSSEDILPGPLIAYFIDINTGEKTYLTPLKFEGISLRALRDIVITEDKDYVYNFYEKGPFYNSDSIPVSIICPRSILISEIEVVKTDIKPEKKPYVPHPYFGK